jgi:hypothetical protein
MVCIQSMAKAKDICQDGWRKKGSGDVILISVRHLIAITIIS